MHRQNIFMSYFIVTVAVIVVLNIKLLHFLLPITVGFGLPLQFLVTTSFTNLLYHFLAMFVINNRWFSCKFEKFNIKLLKWFSLKNIKYILRICTCYEPWRLMTEFPGKGWKNSGLVKHLSPHYADQQMCAMNVHDQLKGGCVLTKRWTFEHWMWCYLLHEQQWLGLFKNINKI